jgi:hypothetical protein
MALKTSNVIDVGDDWLPRARLCRRNQRDAAWRHVERAAGEFATIGEHVAAGKIDLYTLAAAALLIKGQDNRWIQLTHDGAGFARELAETVR